jgi:membrane protease YdiL (CAAX protease family)
VTNAKPWPGLGWALGLLGLGLAAQAASALVWIKVWPGVDLTLMAGLANLCALVPLAAVGYAVSGRGPALGRPRAPVGLWGALSLTAAGGTIVLGELSNLTAWLVPLPPALAHLFNQLTEGPPWVALFTLSFVAPLTEESLFRGLLLPSFERRWGVAPALVLSSALFALFHLNVWQALPAFAAGLYLGWLYLACGSLWPPMAAHALFNGLPVVLSAMGVTVAGYNTPSVPGVLESQPPLWLALGAAMVGTGLWLTTRWAPLPPPPVSDTMGP